MRKPSPPPSPSIAAKARSSLRTRHLDLTNTDKAVTYLSNNHKHVRYDKALEKGWPIATGMIEGASTAARVNTRSSAAGLGDVTDPAEKHVTGCLYPRRRSYEGIT